MAESVLEAIKRGDWDFEPEEDFPSYDNTPTDALPGTDQKLTILAGRVQQGLPLWHPNDRRSYDDSE